MTTSDEAKVSPFLKWPGGKRWLVSRHAEVFPEFQGKYIEPFLGGGAVYFYMKPQDALLTDVNEWLIVTYKAIRDGWRVVNRLLESHQTMHSQDYYYRVRAMRPSNRFERAAQLLYLNRTCWNGLFRVNRKGDFNVPIGTKTNVLLGDDFEAISRLLRKATIRNTDFEDTIEEAVRGDLIFADPPYTVKHNLNGFVKYNENIFSWDDQERLAGALRRAVRRGVKVVLTNANHNSIRKLYKEGFEINEIGRASVLAGKTDYRSRTSELLIKAG